MDKENKKAQSLYSMWLDAHKRNALPPEWLLAHNFLTWATANGYKTEYGYKGEFNPASLLSAMRGNGGPSVEELVENNTLAALKEMATGIDLGNAKTKKEIAMLIVAAGTENDDSDQADEPDTKEDSDDAGE